MTNPEDDLEHQYRDFADHYPFEPGNPGWDELLAKMVKSGPVTKPIPYPFIKKYWYAFASLLLVIITSVILFYNNRHTVLSNNKLVPTPENSSGSALLIPQADKKPSTQKQISISSKPYQSPPETIHNNTQVKPVVDYITAKTAREVVILGDTGIRVKALPAPGPGYNIANNSPQANKKINSLSTSPLTASQAGAQSALAYKPPLQYDSLDKGINLNQAEYGVHNEKAENAPTLPPAGNIANAVKAGNSGTVEKSTAIAIHKFKKYFYMSLLAGPDVSTVKFQGGSEAGISAGIIAGIQLSKRVSIESGILIDKKNYFSSGKYFNKNSAGVTDPDDQITTVNGIGNFVELPVIVRVNVIQKRRSELFVAAGLSSYITNRERYTFDIQRPTGPETRGSDDDDRVVNLFSVLHVSGGYQFTINAHNTLQVEPYIKLPFSGIGRGSLPITSTGVYLRYTHKLFK